MLPLRYPRKNISKLRLSDANCILNRETSGNEAVGEAATLNASPLSKMTKTTKKAVLTVKIGTETNTAFVENIKLTQNQ